MNNLSGVVNIVLSGIRPRDFSVMVSSQRINNLGHFFTVQCPFCKVESPEFFIPMRDMERKREIAGTCTVGFMNFHGCKENLIYMEEQ